MGIQNSRSPRHPTDKIQGKRFLQLAQRFNGFPPKLSMSMLLNSNFKGGDLEIFGADIHPNLLNPGDSVFFPSFMHHRVTPVTEGTRYSLVVWFTGPPFL